MGLPPTPENPDAVGRVFLAKGRPRFNPLIVHVASMALARRVAVFDARAEKLAEIFWPGPLTLVLPRAAGAPVADLALAGLPTVAIRMPAHPVARELLAAFGGPLAAPSANRSGHVSPTTAAHVAADLGDAVALVLDGGPSSVGVESTIVGLEGDSPVLLRAGGVTARRDRGGASARRWPRRSSIRTRRSRRACSPRTTRRARWCASTRSRSRPGEALLAFGPSLPKGAERAAAVVNLSERGDLAEAAASFFAALRALDARADVIAVAPIPDEGLGEAINDRLRRAAAPPP